MAAATSVIAIAGSTSRVDLSTGAMRTAPSTERPLVHASAKFRAENGPMTHMEPEIVYSRDQREPFARRQVLARAAKSGALERVAVGAYLPAAVWGSLTPRARYLARVRAVAETRRHRPVLSHWSAAAVHDLPVIGDWPLEVHATVSPTSGGRTRNGVVKHSLHLSDADVIEIDGLLVTSVARTVIDIAASSSFLAAVTVVDKSLHADRFGRNEPLTTKTELWTLYRERMPFGGHARAREVLAFGDGKADTPIESVSRVNMHCIGCPRPLLQSAFSDYLGFIGETDFDWPDFALVGEADGKRKYLDAAFRSGRSVAQVMVDEKDREDRLRAKPLGVSRWGWNTAINPTLLRAKLSHAGLPMGSGWQASDSARS